MKIFLLGATPSFDVANVLTIEARLKKTGGNSGNQVIAYGLLESLVYDHVDWDYSVGPEAVDRDYDMIVIAAANFLFPGFDFGPMAAFIESTKLPVAIVGLGAQSKDYSTKIALLPGTERFVRVVAERAPKIGVRGEFTAKVLAEMGVHNVQVVGCPSFYMEGSTAPAPVKKPFEEVTRIAINGSRDVVVHAFDREKMLATIYGLEAEAIRYKGIFVAQTELDEMKLADPAGRADVGAASERLAAFFSKGGIDAATLKSWAASHMRVYWQVERWLEDMKSLDYVAGTRFHGAMAAINVGTPATILCHDTRTTEMSEFFCLPHFDIRTLEKINLRELYEAMDLEALAARRLELVPAYRRFLAENGLKYRF